MNRKCTEEGKGLLRFECQLTRPKLPWQTKQVKQVGKQRPSRQGGVPCPLLEEEEEDEEEEDDEEELPAGWTRNPHGLGSLLSGVRLIC